MSSITKGSLVNTRGRNVYAPVCVRRPRATDAGPLNHRGAKEKSLSVGVLVDAWLWVPPLWVWLARQRG